MNLLEAQLLHILNMKRLMRNYESPESESESEQESSQEVDVAQKRVIHKFKQVESFDSLEGAHDAAVLNGYSYNYRVKADPETNRKVLSYCK